MHFLQFANPDFFHMRVAVLFWSGVFDQKNPCNLLYLKMLKTDFAFKQTPIN